MPITVEAVYEKGVLKPTRALPFQEHQKVMITVRPAQSRVRLTAGLIGWTGIQEDADFVATVFVDAGPFIHHFGEGLLGGKGPTGRLA